MVLRIVASKYFYTDVIFFSVKIDVWYSFFKATYNLNTVNGSQHASQLGDKDVFCQGQLISKGIFHQRAALSGTVFLHDGEAVW